MQVSTLITFILLNIFCQLYSSQLISESFVKHAGQLWGTIIINMTAHLRQNL